MGNEIGRAVTGQTRPIDTKVQVKIGGAAHFDESGAGGGVNLRVDKNFKLNESIYLKGTAGAEIYSNTKGADIGVELQSAKGNITPSAGLELQYRQSGVKYHRMHSVYAVEGNEIETIRDMKYRDNMLNANIKAGIEGMTSNGRFTAGAGIKLGGMIDIGSTGSSLHNAADVTVPVTEEMSELLNQLLDKQQNRAQTRTTTPPLNDHLDPSDIKVEIGEQTSKPKELPKHLNLGAYAHAEYKLGKGLSLFANGEYGHNVKEGTVGIRYTF